MGATHCGNMGYIDFASPFHRKAKRQRPGAVTVGDLKEAEAAGYFGLHLNQE